MNKPIKILIVEDRVIDAIQYESNTKRPIPDKKLSVVKRS